MAHFLRVRVASVAADHIQLTLPEGAVFKWKRPAESDPFFDQIHIGDELIITLTRSTDLINEFLAGSAHAQNTKPSSVSPIPQPPKKEI